MMLGDDAGRHRGRKIFEIREVFLWYTFYTVFVVERLAAGGKVSSLIFVTSPRPHRRSRPLKPHKGTRHQRDQQRDRFSRGSTETTTEISYPCD
jgi:hypothetical protein